MLNQELLFFNIGGSEMIIILLVIIMFFGSKKIPELARGLGKGIKELKNATNEIQQEIKDSAGPVSSIKDKVDIEKQVKELLKEEKKEEISEVDEDVNNEEAPDLPKTVKRNTPYSSENKNS